MMVEKLIIESRCKSILQARDYIEKLDLNYIVQAMCSEHYPMPRWTVSDAKIACRLYKNFLVLQKIYRGEPLVPTREIDEFWHNHILHTQKYIHDCKHIFGSYLHHAPSEVDDNLEDLSRHYQKTKEYYLKEFNEPLAF